MTNKTTPDDDWLFIILANYSDDLAALKKRNGLLPAQAAAAAINAKITKLVENSGRTS